MTRHRKKCIKSIMAFPMDRKKANLIADLVIECCGQYNITMYEYIEKLSGNWQTSVIESYFTGMADLF